MAILLTFIIVCNKFSVATTSMVGYILGLGDRHTQNILIDQKTAEVIHIDFGMFKNKWRCLKMIKLYLICVQNIE